MEAATDFTSIKTRANISIFSNTVSLQGFKLKDLE